MTHLNSKIDWDKFIQSTTLSSSGWRRIFNHRGDPHSLQKHVDADHTYFISTASKVIAEHFKRNKKTQPILVVGRDSRPTGSAISKIIINTLRVNNIKIYDLGVTSLPQCSATVRANGKLAGFVFITASHNPPGYNGIKLGNYGGEVISPATNQKLVNQLKKKLFTLKRSSKKTIPSKYPDKGSHLTFDSANDYRISLLMTMGYTAKPRLSQFESMVKKLAGQNYAIACDFNGSARIQSIDKSLIKELGIHFLACNEKLGRFVHDIVPEEKSLDTLRKKMRESGWRKYRVLFGYAVDCDGDRGNIVINTEQKGRVIPLAPDAQTTFALSVLAELCYLEAFFPHHLKNTVIVANDPTSLRIDHLAKKFGVSVTRAEVGEANVVGLARTLRKQGRHTPIMGEGSNGGSIIHPAVVRDPLSMVTSLIKLMFLDNGKISLKDIAVQRLGLPSSFKGVPEDFFLGKIIPHINTYHSTSVFDPSALITTPYSTQKNFKRIYENLWQQTWKKQRQQFRSWGVIKYRILNYEGIHTYPGEGNRHGDEDGGHKISFFNERDGEIGFIWFRFSKTEPVLRLSAEHHDPKIQKKLFSLQHNLLQATAKEDNHG